MRKSDTSSQKSKRGQSRVFSEGGEWFYRTREGHRGPFVSELALRSDLNSYISTMEFVEDNAGCIPSDVDFEDVTVVEIECPRFC